jgi:hypothetical protein
MEMTLSLPGEKRYKMYKDMLTYDARIWRQEHHIAKVFINVAVGNITLYTLYKLYYHIYDPKYPFTYSLVKPKFIKTVLLVTLVNSSLIYLNYNYLPRVIYEEFYDKQIVNDMEFLDLYDHIVTKQKLIK